MPNVYEIITARVVEKLEHGVIPWKKPWVSSDRPNQNFLSRKPYRGINVWLTAMEGFSSPFWMTFKQAQSLGANVRKGEHGTPVVYWNRLQVTDRNESGEDVEKSIPFARYFTVFNVEQVDGLPMTKAELFPEQQERAFSPIDAAERILDNMPERPVTRYFGSRAVYNLQTDVLTLPERERFTSDSGFYATAFHECGHATGHPSRLDRHSNAGLTVATNHGAIRAREELCAEMTAAFLCGTAGIENEIDNCAAYVASWLAAIKGDPKAVIVAATWAQKAADYILGTSAAQAAEDASAAA